MHCKLQTGKNTTFKFELTLKEQCNNIHVTVKQSTWHSISEDWQTLIKYQSWKFLKPDSFKANRWHPNYLKPWVLYMVSKAWMSNTFLNNINKDFYQMQKTIYQYKHECGMIPFARQFKRETVKRKFITCKCRLYTPVSNQWGRKITS